MPIVGTIGQQFESVGTSALGSPYSQELNTWSVYTLNGTAIPATSTGSSAQFFFPAKSDAAIIVTNFTEQDAITSVLRSISIAPGINTNETLNVSLAFGTNRSYTTIYEILSDKMSMKNGTVVESSKLIFNFSSYYFSFPSGDHLIFIITGAAYGSLFSGTVTSRGNTNSFISTVFNPLTFMNTGLLFIGILGFVFTYFSAPWVEVHPEEIYRRGKATASRLRQQRLKSKGKKGGRK